MPRQTDKAPDNTNFLVWLAADGLDQELELPILLMGIDSHSIPWIRQFDNLKIGTFGAE